MAPKSMTIPLTSRPNEHATMVWPKSQSQLEAYMDADVAKEVMFQASNPSAVPPILILPTPIDRDTKHGQLAQLQPSEDLIDLTDSSTNEVRTTVKSARPANTADDTKQRSSRHDNSDGIFRLEAGVPFETSLFAPSSAPRTTFPTDNSPSVCRHASPNPSDVVWEYVTHNFRHQDAMGCNLLGCKNRHSPHEYNIRRCALCGMRVCWPSFQDRFQRGSRQSENKRKRQGPAYQRSKARFLEKKRQEASDAASQQSNAGSF